MLQQLSLEEFQELSRSYSRVAVFQEFPADRLTPILVLEILAASGDDSILLESGLNDEEKHSFLGISSFASFESKNGKSTVLFEGVEEAFSHASPLTILKQLLEKFKVAPCPHLPPLVGGALGFISYDAVRLFEKIPSRHEDLLGIPDLHFRFYDTFITFDHLKKTLFLSVIVEVGEDAESAYKKAKKKIRDLFEKLRGVPKISPKSPSHPFQYTVDLNDEEYGALVERAKEYIHSGDVFQIVLSRNFKVVPLHASALDVYRALRIVSPSPFMFYIRGKDFSIVGSSPERLLRVKNQYLETVPIAGTRKRGEGTEEEKLEKELLNDPKEDAEHMMLVDLGRNDLGMVSLPGSVQVKELKKIHRFSHLMHLVSVIEGVLRSDKSAFDALAAVFPAGTLSGAPKIRAMEIIDELETSKRGLYGGAICTLDSFGNLDSCIAIRMAVIKDQVAIVRTGAGIVFDSDPQREAEETRQKAQGILEALRFAEEGVL